MTDRLLKALATLFAILTLLVPGSGRSVYAQSQLTLLSPNWDKLEKLEPVWRREMEKAGLLGAEDPDTDSSGVESLGALTAAHAYLRRVAGPNDGVVPIASQYWGETLAEIEADHFAQIGWRVDVRTTFDAQGLYAFVIARLGDAPPAAATPARSAAGRS